MSLTVYGVCTVAGLLLFSYLLPGYLSVQTLTQAG